MPHPRLDRDQLTFRPLQERANRVSIERDLVRTEDAHGAPSAEKRAVIADAAERIQLARKNGRSVILAFGAHTIKNGLAPVLIRLMEQKWITHLATNGAGIIHDWELAFEGKTSEHVEPNVKAGCFGMWQETGYFINLALVAGAYEGLGYGESVGTMILNDGLTIPDETALKRAIAENADRAADRAAAAADYLGVVRHFNLKAGPLTVKHAFKHHSVQAAATRLSVPFTGHPMIGHDIIYNHPMNLGAAVGRTAVRDFLSFAHSVTNLDGGVYLSVGSAVMSPMIFEKSLSMAQNLRIAKGQAPMNGHVMLVVDLAESNWDWSSKGEPPSDDPAYYLRYCKTFSRMGGTMRYLSADNRDFLLALYRELGGH